MWGEVGLAKGRKREVGGEERKRTGIVSFPIPIGVGGDVLLLLLLVMMLLLVAAGEHLFEELKLGAGERGEEAEKKNE